MQEQPITPSTNAGNITFDDVRVALGETNVMETNSAKIRNIIGRGSYATIQKHLNTLRDQRVAASQPSTEQSVPKAPQDAVEMLWAAAWGAAQTKTLARLESLSAERDGLLSITAAQAADVSALTEQLDTIEAQTLGTATAQATAQATAVEHALAQAHALEQTQAELARVTEAAAHAAELSALTAQVERQALQSTIDRMHEQLGELKALHIVAATAKPASTTKTAAKPEAK